MSETERQELIEICQSIPDIIPCFERQMKTLESFLKSYRSKKRRKYHRGR